ncbi:hypothetical protein [Tenacibaculum maritimum]|uniref:hypothetical protein n=1 Tax=Tenacibaculum maritimum TaxID=107401 RepID=UPI001330CC7D|nr:hypothetical protein [Tenacibaculum maritimum]
MKIRYLISLLIVLCPCMQTKNNSFNHIILDDVEQVYISNLLKGTKVKLSTQDLKTLLGDINKAKFVGKYKWIDQYSLEILLKSSERIELSCNNNMFKINSKGDDTYKISNKVNYFKLLLDNNKKEP